MLRERVRSLVNRRVEIESVEKGSRPVVVVWCPVPGCVEMLQHHRAVRRCSFQFEGDFIEPVYERAHCVDPVDREDISSQ